ncbi:CRISPR-associated endonuclease Cas1 [Vibrio sinaloensis]|uniref:CRISPR-associated endonuclease Cas1 n=1 Tax=Photobacterium sp. (strain ATCC 43367) TaxID=379097 RepID=A0A0A5I3L3_PHOS4|nr:CRISPR-associated endonuclease Cas1 [Vibrio sinaloensis]KGY10359.1 hypothetical protein NM06_05480 [Vibrio sinaloensis]
MTNPILNSIEPIAQLLPLRAMVVTLRFTQDATFQFYHHVAAHAWVRHLCGSPDNFSQQVTVQTLENGKTDYKAGELYRFKLVFTPLGGNLIQPLIDALERLPSSAKALPRGACINNNVELVELKCGVGNEEIHHAIDLYPYDLQALAQDVAHWQQRDDIYMESLTPARLLKEKASQESSRGDARYCRDKVHFSATTITRRFVDTIIGLVESHTGQRYQRDIEASFEIQPELSFWVEHRYGRGEKWQKKPMSGALFSLKVRNVPRLEKWQIALLVLGQWLGIGQSRSMGLGLYWLRDVSETLGGHSNRLIKEYFNQRRLVQLVQESLDSQFSEQERNQYKNKVIGLSHTILAGDYKAPVLTQVEIDKSDGGVRTLSIPPLADRILQKAIARPLAVSLDGLWKTHSYGYRKDLSRHDAKFAINQAIQQGYEWVLESDVDSFFDNVDWRNLQTRLKLLLPNDFLVDVIMAWVKAPVKTPSGQILERTQGLPQGSPLSPLLANLVLDDFDADMLALDYKLIRYADDFVLLFKKQSEAQMALDHVIASLNEHGLNIKAKKTQIVHANKGFRYLGFWFVDGYAIETSRHYRQEEQEYQQAITHHQAQLAESKQREKQQIGEREQLGTLLVIAGEVAMLTCENKRLKITQQDESRYYAWEELETILILGPHNISTPCIRQAMHHQVAIHFASRYGQYQGVACSNMPSQGHQLWQLQIAYLQKVDVALTWSIELVCAKIDGHIHLIRNRERQSPLLEKLRTIKRKARRSDDLQVLLGIEGEAAKLQWEFFKQHLDCEWQFSGRNRRPPKDPINAMLSLGYTYLYHLTDSLIQSNGLCPWAGFYHQPHGAHRTLASDLMEPLRVVVDRTVLALVAKRQIKPDDFLILEDGCEMSREARKVLLTQLLADLTTKRKKSDRVIDQMITQVKEVKIATKLALNPNFWRP